MKLHPYIFIVISTLFLLSCKEDKPTSTEAEAIIINGNKASLFNVDFTEKPTKDDNGNYTLVELGQQVTFIYTGIEKEKIIWTYDGLPLGDGTSLNTSHIWLESGIKEIRATRRDGEGVTVYVMVDGDSTTNTENEPSPEPEVVAHTTTDVSEPSSEPARKPDIIKSDRDGDGVPDEIDECNDQKGLKKFNGCPDIDSDGITDSLDGCPNEKGPKSNNGCPITKTDTKIEVIKPVKATSPTSHSEPEWDPIKTGTTGIINSSCKGKKSVTSTSSINITSQKKAELSYVKVAAEATCNANITITSNDGKKAVQMRNRQLNGGLVNEINFQHLGYVLKPGAVYTITISPADNGYKVSDLSECNTNNGPKDVLDISYSGSKVLFGLVYKY